MLVSMTGFGQGEASTRTSRVTVEIRTVNHRYFDLSVKVPKVLSHREHEIKDLIKGKIKRGRVSITVSTEIDQPEYDVRINVPLVEQYVSQLREFASKHSLPSDLDINTLATLPEVFHLHEHDRNDEELWPLVTKSLKQALVACSKMRQEEGKSLEADIRSRITAINRLIKKVEKRAPKVVAHHSAALKQRLAKIMAGARVDRDRLLTEVALLADRLDFTEEVIRLKSHMSQIKACLDGGGAVSKKLTYLLQEVHRESTTIASKASDAEVVEYVISLKEESERLREQVQNLE
ncbi:MAG: YicC family protein [Candidatus Krumholzibacteria bacterium]|nr:YicC family protein [Candidatus Krumholzibacteria bacterium]